MGLQIKCFLNYGTVSDVNTTHPEWFGHFRTRQIFTSAFTCLPVFSYITQNDKSFLKPFIFRSSQLLHKPWLSELICPHVFQPYPSWITPPSFLSFLAPNLLTWLVNISFGRLGDLVKALEKVSGSSISCSCANSSSADKAVKGGGEAGRERIDRIVLVQNYPWLYSWWFMFCLMYINLPISSVWFHTKALFYEA